MHEIYFIYILIWIACSDYFDIRAIAIFSSPLRGRKALEAVAAVGDDRAEQRLHLQAQLHYRFFSLSTFCV